jgi:hypothetical protein
MLRFHLLPRLVVFDGVWIVWETIGDGQLERLLKSLLVAVYGSVTAYLQWYAGENIHVSVAVYHVFIPGHGVPFIQTPRNSWQNLEIPSQSQATRVQGELQRLLTNQCRRREDEGRYFRLPCQMHHISSHLECVTP